MAAVATNPAVAKRTKIPQSVGKEFMSADKGKKFKGGGMAESKKMVGKEIAFMKKKGAPKSMVKHEEGEMKAMKKMAMGGIPPRDIGTGAGPRRPLPQAINKPGMGPRDIGTGAGPRGPRTPISLPKPIPGNYMKKGGVATSKMGSVRTASPSRDGVASKGKTVGKQVVMKKRGGMC